MLSALGEVGTAGAEGVLGPIFGLKYQVPFFEKGDITSVSCPSSNFCVASDGGGDIYTFDGTNWSLPQHLVNPRTENIVGTSCASPTRCVALDSTSAFTLHGSAWSPAARVEPSWSHATLQAVSCPSPLFCAAGDGGGDLFTFDGTSWSAPHFVGPHVMDSLSCPVSNYCLASSADGATFVYRHQQWTAGTALGFGGASVSCGSPVGCMAVGDGHASTFDGKSWSNVQTDGQIRRMLIGTPSVSCVAAGPCVAVGSGEVAIYKDFEWSRPVAVHQIGLLTVSCSPATVCVVLSEFGGVTGIVA